MNLMIRLRRRAWPCLRLKDVSSSCRSIFQNRVLILTYHQVTPSVGYDPLQLKVTVKNFESHMASSRRCFEVISIADFVMQLNQSHLRQTRQIVITFDDGYWDNYAFAAPILHKYELPAIVYLTANYIGIPRNFWWDEVEDIVMGYQASNLEVDEPIGQQYCLTDERRRVGAIIDLCSRLRKLSVDEREGMLGRLRAYDRLPRREDARPMTWEEARALTRYGMNIGAHSCNHQALSSLTEADARQEVEQSKRVIDGQLQTEIGHFSYPHDDADYHLQRLSEISRRLVLDAGFQSGVTIIRGVNRVEQDVMALRRLTVRNWNAAEFRWQIEKAFLDWI